MKNEAESQAVFVASYVRNVRGRAMLPDSTVLEQERYNEPAYLHSLISVLLFA